DSRPVLVGTFAVDSSVVPQNREVPVAPEFSGHSLIAGRSCRAIAAKGRVNPFPAVAPHFPPAVGPIAAASFRSPIETRAAIACGQRGFSMSAQKRVSPREVSSLGPHLRGTLVRLREEDRPLVATFDLCVPEETTRHAPTALRHAR